MNKSITEEMVKDVIKEWARNKAENGKIIFDETFCGGKFVRYKTDKMTLLIPDNIEGKLSGWKRPDHYAYEIECNQTILNLMLTFSYTNISDETKKICEKLWNNFKMMPKMDTEKSGDNYFRLCIYDANIKEYNEKEIYEAMDKLFYQMKGYEEFICYKLQEGKI